MFNDRSRWGSQDRMGWKISTFFSLLALVCFIIAAAFPSWVVLSIEGEGKVLGHAYDVDFKVGSGLFRRNVCYGGDRPDEDFLKHIGLSCNGKSQTKHCSRKSVDKNNPDFNEECSRFVTAQVMEMLAIVFGVIAVTAGCFIDRDLMTVTSIIMLSSIMLVVGSAVAEADMKKTRFFSREDKFDCRSTETFEICETYGMSLHAQEWGIVFAAIALAINTILYVFVLVQGDRSGNKSDNQPLMGQGA